MRIIALGCLGAAMVLAQGTTPETKLLQDMSAATKGCHEAKSKHDQAAAREQCGEEVRLSRGLPDSLLDMKAEALKDMAEVAGADRNYQQEESLIKERVALLEKDKRSMSYAVALFDLESFYGETHDADKALDAANQAISFYKGCASPPCQRRVAEVEATMGSIYLQAKRSTDAETWFARVVGRPEDAVPPQVMLLSLRSYAQILHDRGDAAASKDAARRATAFQRKHPELKSQ